MNKAWVWALVALPAVAATAVAGPDQPAKPAARKVVVLHTSAEAVGPAWADLQTIPRHLWHQVRYASIYNAPDEQLADWDKAACKAFNSWSRNNVMVPPYPVPGGNGRLWRVVLSDYRIPPKAYDDFIATGSGRSPSPEPYFHFVGQKEHDDYKTVEYGHWEDSYGSRHSTGSTTTAQAEANGWRWVTTRTEKVKKSTGKQVVGQTRWLPSEDLVKLVAATGSDNPIARLDWVVYYGFLEPAYHTLLGLDDTEDSFKQLAGVKEVKDDDETVELGSVVLQSEVASNNRALFRDSSRKRQGRAYWWESRDFDKSIGADDILQDPSKIVAKAKEVIFSLPNGLQGYGVFDAKGKRLDRAAIEFAHDGRNGFRSVEVEIRNCMCCHAEGVILVADEVRGYSGDQIKLALRQFYEKDAKKAAFVADRYFSADINTIAGGDQQSYAAAVRSCNGLAPTASALLMRKVMLQYEKPLLLQDLSLETGFPPIVVLGVLERAGPTGLDHSASRLAQRKLPNRPAPQSRRDQFEALGFGQLMTLLSRVPVQQPPPTAKAPEAVARRKSGGCPPAR